MGATKIEWTDHSWNPVAGCAPVSAGCKNCYAERMARRLKGMGTPAYQGLTTRGGKWTGEVALIESALEIPLKRKKPTTWFVPSMGDLFHVDVPNDYILRVLDVCRQTPQHRYLILTKRAERMERLFSAGFPVLDNVGLGVSVENQAVADDRIPLLCATPARFRFLSVEPLLEPINMNIFDLCSPDWVIVGGESGTKARRCSVKWIRQIITQCKYNEVPVFVKQMGSHAAGFRDPKGGDPSEWPEDLRVRETPEWLSATHERSD